MSVDGCSKAGHLRSGWLPLLSEVAYRLANESGRFCRAAFHRGHGSHGAWPHGRMGDQA